MVSFSVSAFYSCWAWTCNYRPLVEKMVMKRHWQGIFHRSESGEESMGNKQWDCLYKNLHALLYGVTVWKLFFIRKSIHSEPTIFLFHNLTVRKKKETNKPRILAHFQTCSGELLSELVWMVTHPWTTNGNSGTDHFELFMKQSTLTFWALCLRTGELNKSPAMVIIKEE